MYVLALSLAFSHKEFAYYTGHTFRGLTISEAPTGYNIIIRTLCPKGRGYYAMCTAEDPAEGLTRLFEAVSSKGGSEVLHLDKYYSGNSHR